MEKIVGFAPGRGVVQLSHLPRLHPKSDRNGGLDPVKGRGLESFWLVRGPVGVQDELLLGNYLRTNFLHRRTVPMHFEEHLLGSFEIGEDLVVVDELLHA